MPQITIRHRSIEFYQFFGYRMNKTYIPGMQTDTSIRIGTWRTILQITFNRASHLCQLATNLMMTSGLKVDLKQEVIIRTADKLIAQNCFLTIGNLLIISIALILFFVTYQIMYQLTFRLPRAIFHNSPIGLSDLTVLEHLIQPG